MYLKHKDPPLQSTKEDMYFAEWELRHKNLLFNFQSRTSCFPTVTNYLHLCCHMFLQSGRTCDSGGDHPLTQVHSHWNWTSQRMIQMHEISLSAKIMTHAYLSIVHIVYVKLEQALSWLCTSMFQQAIYVTVLEHGCSKTCTVLGWSSKPSYAYDTTLHVQCTAKYMIECMIFRIARCCFLHPSPAHIITCMTTWKSWCYISLKKKVKRKAELSVMQGYSLHRKFSSQYQALDVIASDDDMENQPAPVARRMVSGSSLHTPAMQS